MLSSYRFKVAESALPAQLTGFSLRMSGFAAFGRKATPEPPPHLQAPLVYPRVYGREGEHREPSAFAP